jgi:hypothetical protein
MKTLPVIGKILVMLLLNAAILFVTSGDLRWRGAWLFLSFFTVATFITSGLLFPSRRGLVEERWGKKDNIKTWDKLLMPMAAIISPLIAVVVAGLDIRFSGEKNNSLSWQVSGLIIGGLSCLVLSWSMLTSRFFSTHVRI